MIPIGEQAMVTNTGASRFMLGRVGKVVEHLGRDHLVVEFEEDEEKRIVFAEWEVGRVQ